ncbi:hypothetical protein [Actinokineospora sp. HUAS TT18]|uniref:hypothetical protein n=1 Tax=Actinokineospora sp. HUAS TT18 TaxID=3447451 RepID=UPI003F521A65
MISRVAVLPNPPLLVPELVAGDDADVAAVRAAALAVAKDLAQVARRWWVVGAGEPTSARAGTFAGFGVDVRVELGEDAENQPADPDMPLPALVAGWLRRQVGAQDVHMDLVSPDLPPAECLARGAAIPDTALLVLGDGSHRHGDRAVGRPDARAEEFDSAVRDAFANVDLDKLLALDPKTADELGAAGRAPWQVLAGAIAKDGRPWRCVESSLLIPFGVAYHFAVWEPA